MAFTADTSVACRYHCPRNNVSLGLVACGYLRRSSATYSTWGSCRRRTRTSSREAPASSTRLASMLSDSWRLSWISTPVRLARDVERSVSVDDLEIPAACVSRRSLTIKSRLAVAYCVEGSCRTGLNSPARTGCACRATRVVITAKRRECIDIRVLAMRGPQRGSCDSVATQDQRVPWIFKIDT